MKNIQQKTKKREGKNNYKCAFKNKNNKIRKFSKKGHKSA